MDKRLAMTRLTSSERAASSTADMSQTVLAAVVVGFVALGILPQGVFHQIASDGLTVAISVFAAIVYLRIGEHPRAAGLSRFALAAAVVLAAYILWQSWLSPGAPFANPAFKAVGDLVAVERQSVALDPADSMAALGPSIAPFLFFIAVLSISRNDETAKKVVVFLALFGVALALYSFLRLRFLPPGLELGPVKVAFEDLGTIFGERNAAATFLGLAVLAQAGQVARSMYGHEWLDTIARVFDPWRPVRKRERRALVYAGMLVLTVAALAMTQSRSGMISTGVGLAVFILVGLVTARRPNDVRVALAPSARRTMGRAAMVLAVSAVILVAGYVALTQVDVTALTADFGYCNVAGVVQAVRENWLLGTGLGAFDLASAAYRDPACVVNDAWGRVDDTYVAALLALGLIAPVLLVIAVVALVGNFAMACRRRHRHNWASMLGFGTLALVGTQAALDLSVETPATLLMVAAVLGTSAALAIDQRAVGTDGADTKAP